MTRSTTTPVRPIRPGHRIAPLTLAALLSTGLALVACGDEDETVATSAPASSVATTVPVTADASTTTAVPTTVPATTPPSTSSASTSPASTSSPTDATEAPTTTVAAASQPAVWPAADVVFTTPEEAAGDFVEQMLRVPPVLGPFMAGDARSGEIEVFSPGEGGPGSSVVRSLLLLRRLGPDDGWFVLAAVEPHVSITSPTQGAEVPAGPVEITGAARGYEATIIVRVAVAGSATLIVDPVIAMGGSLETPEPYAATVDLSGVPAGTVVTLLVHGSTGLETDPGEFSAIAVTIAD